jgi:mRNA interferase RelE/StbE
MYRLRYRRQARNYLARLPFKIKSNIMEKLHEVQKDLDSPKIDLDKLKGGAGYRRRAGPYKIVYARDRDQLIIDVVNIRTRGDIYKR